MANYTFSCPNCGEFTEWHTSMQGNKQISSCPECEAEAKRVFLPPITFRMNSKLKTTIAEGMEPKLMTKDELPKVPLKKVTRRRRETPRPWQAVNLD
ncbi:MAG TPA: zinc ribbon domain-containing protein [Bacillota bacterium]|nr:zinc ribbon domain-containing protein [Bacillota bacterium]